MQDIFYDNFSSWTRCYDNIWVYSDTHFNDPDCLLMNANWPTSDEHVKKINSKVKKNDLLILLGDVGDISYVSKINGTKILIKGNHDSASSNYKRKCDLRALGTVDELNWNDEETRRELIASLRKNIVFTSINVHLDLDGKERVYIEYDNRLFDEVYEGPLFINKKILLSHEPIDIPFGYNIHGHTHKGQSKYLQEKFASINVCSNLNNFEPQRLDKLISKYKTIDIHRLWIDNAIQNNTTKINQILNSALLLISKIVDITDGRATLEFAKRYVETYNNIEYLLEDIQNNHLKVFANEEDKKRKDNFKII